MNCQKNGCLSAVNHLYKVVILKAEIYHDIDSDTHALQRFRKALDVPLATDENGRYLIDRYIDRAVNQVAKRLTAYIATEHPHATVNNHTFPWEEHTFHLVMPSSWPPETLDGLKDSIHRYIVRSVEAELARGLSRMKRWRRRWWRRWRNSARCWRGSASRRSRPR